MVTRSVLIALLAWLLMLFARPVSRSCAEEPKKNSDQGQLRLPINPLKTVSKGDWNACVGTQTLSHSPSGQRRIMTLWTVTEVTSDTVVIERDTSLPDVSIRKQSLHSLKRAEAPTLVGLLPCVSDVRDATVTNADRCIRGRTFGCKRLTGTEDEGYGRKHVVEVSLSEDVLVFGLVAFSYGAVDGSAEEELELVGYGHEGTTSWGMTLESVKQAMRVTDSKR